MIPKIYNDEFKQFSNIAIENNHFTVFGSHSHTFYEIEYICEGEVMYDINGKSTVISAGDMVLVSPMDLHSYKARNNSIVRTITIHFNPDNLEGLNIIKSAVIHCDTQMRDMIYLLQKEYQKSDKYTPAALKNILSYIIVSLLRHKGIESDIEIPESISHVIGYINSNFREEINLDMLSEKAGYSKSYLCRQFKKYMNTGIIEYLNNARLSYAEKLLVVHNLTVSQVSFECGFGSVRHFNRLFSERYGISPLQFVKKHKTDKGITT